jgi:UDP-N-acetylglucosamine diphosphorylase / glucose-1-phosphate thymidylyltransferase / UDP-N-acetylgalactosamine diphosphorylase / glucosamine-1-phosphate N-acetyltransferase / galactosamine-1-phosphate N-acetyltransferase
MQIIIPMAGAGSRFSQAGYQLPKPLIDVAGEPMISRVMDNLGTNHQYWFIVQKAVWAEHSVQLTRAAQKCAMHTFLLTDGLTQGAAETCLLAERMWDPEEPLMIANCDQVQDWDSDHFYDWFLRTPSDGSIITFYSHSIKNSYVKIDNLGWVVEAREKEVISNLATTGVYVWRKAKYFMKAAHDMISRNIRVNNEFYVCPVYNFNLMMGHKINTYHINKHWPIGTPEDLNMYLQEKHVHHA